MTQIYASNFVVTQTAVIFEKARNSCSQWKYSSSSTYLGAHCWPKAAHRGPVQRPAPVPLPGGEAAAGEAEDGGAERADPTGWAQSPAVRGDFSSAGSRPRDRGQAERAGSVHSVAGELIWTSSTINTVHLEVIRSMLSQLWWWLRWKMLSFDFRLICFQDYYFYYYIETKSEKVKPELNIYFIVQSDMCFLAKMLKGSNINIQNLTEQGWDRVCTPFFKAINMFMSACMYLKSELWHSDNNGRMWSHSSMWRDKEFLV